MSLPHLPACGRSAHPPGSLRTCAVGECGENPCTAICLARLGSPGFSSLWGSLVFGWEEGCKHRGGPGTRITAEDSQQDWLECGMRWRATSSPTSSPCLPQRLSAEARTLREERAGPAAGEGTHLTHLFCFPRGREGKGRGSPGVDKADKALREWDALTEVRKGKQGCEAG